MSLQVLSVYVSVTYTSSFVSVTRTVALRPFGFEVFCGSQCLIIWQSVSDIVIRNRHFKKSFINMTVKSQFKLKTCNCQTVKVNDMRASCACQSRTAMAPNAKRRRQQIADQQESDDECVAHFGRNVMQLRNEAATGFDQRLDLNTILCRDEPNFCQSVCQVAQNVQGVASRWPDRVALVGWAADLRADQGYKGFWMKVAGRWQSVFNPVEALSDCIDAEMQFHNLATLLPKDPMVEMSLEVT